MINIWAVLVATAVYFVIGSLWYSPFLLGKAWMKSIGKTQEELKMGPHTMIGSIIISFVVPLIVALILELIGTWDLITALLVSLIVFAIFASLGLNPVLYEDKSIVTYLINCGHQLVGLLIIGIILGIWKI